MMEHGGAYEQAIRSVIEGLPETDQQDIYQCFESIKATVEEYGQNGKIGLALAAVLFSDR